MDQKSRVAMSKDIGNGISRARSPHHSIDMLRYAGVEEITEEAAIDIHASLARDDDAPEEPEEVRWLRHERLQLKNLHWSVRPSLVMIVAVVFLCCLGLGFCILANVDLLLQLICRAQLSKETGHDFNFDFDASLCDKLKVQSELLDMQKKSSLVSGVISVVVSSKLGQLSDVYGRCRVLFLCVFFQLLSFGIRAFLLGPSLNFYKQYLFILCESIGALGGGLSGIRSISFAYLVDVVDEDKRIFSMGVLGAAMSIGISLGPIMSSLMIKYFFSPIQTIYTTCVVYIGILVFITCVLPESRSERSRKLSMADQESQFELRRVILQELGARNNVYRRVWENVKSFFTPMKLLYLPITQENGKKSYRRRYTLLLLTAIDVLWNLCAVLAMITSALYAIYMFDWTSVELGFFISVTNAARLLVLLVLSPFVLQFANKTFTANSKLVDAVDLFMIKISFVAFFTSVIFMVLAHNSGMFVFAGVIDSFAAIFQPALSAATVKYAPLESVGALMGALSSVQGLVSLFGPAVFFSIYSLTVATQPRTYLYVTLGILVACGLILLSIRIEDDDKIELSDE